MSDDRHVTLFHNPRSRSRGVLVLLEELGARYSLQPIDLEKEQQRTPEFLAINPMGKIPTIVHGTSVVTEQGAIYQYLAELYPEAGLSPAPGDADRGAYLRWLAFYGSAFEPAIIDLALKRPAPPRHARSRLMPTPTRCCRWSMRSWQRAITCWASAAVQPMCCGAAPWRGWWTWA